MQLDTREFNQSTGGVLLKDVRDELTVDEGYKYSKMVNQNERSDSEELYAGKAVDAQLDELIQLDPKNRDMYEEYKSMNHNDRFLAEDVNELGWQKSLFRGEDMLDVVTNNARNILKGWSSPSATYLDLKKARSLSAQIAQKRKDFGLDDLSTVRKNSLAMAKQDYETGTEALRNVDFFSAAGFGELLSGAKEGLSDPMTHLEILGTAGVSTEARLGASGIRQLGKAFAVGSGTAVVSEVPIQVSAYRWKDRADIDWSVTDAVIQGAGGILIGGAFLTGAKALFDLLPKKIKKMKASKNPMDVESARRFEVMTEGASTKNLHAHVEMLQAMRAAKESGQSIDVVKALGLQEKTEVGKIFDDAEANGELSLRQQMESNFEEQLNDTRVLHITDTKAKPTAEFTQQIDYDELDTLGIQNQGKNDILNSRLQEVETWAQDISDDFSIGVQKVDAAGNEIVEQVPLKKTIQEANDNIDNIQKLMECAYV